MNTTLKNKLEFKNFKSTSSGSYSSLRNCIAKILIYDKYACHFATSNP